MVRLRLAELKALITSFKELINKNLTVSTAWELAEIQEELIEKEKLYSDMIGKILAQYAEKDDNGKFLIDAGNYVVSNENIEEFNRQVAELMEIEIELKIEPINIDRLVLSSGKSIDISSTTLLNLKKILKR